MAKKKNEGTIYYPNAFNEAGSGGPEKADTNGPGIYFGGCPEMLDMHLQQSDITSTPNSRSGQDILGGPTKNDPSAMEEEVARTLTGCAASYPPSSSAATHSGPPVRMSAQPTSAGRRTNRPIAGRLPLR